jgi:ubiquinone/menaquinone biosynthesis C-methylase UbiE
MVDECVESLAEIFSMREDSLGKVSERFFRHYDGFQGNKKKIGQLVKTYRQYFEVCDCSGKTVVDVGCGFGLQPAVYALSGAQKVVGVDPVAGNIRFCNYLKQRYLSQCPGLDFLIQDGCSLGLRDESMDVAVMTESLSHMDEPSSSLEEAHRILRQGGILHIVDGNNSLAVPSRLKRRLEWKRMEDESFRPKRIEIIKDIKQDLDGDMIEAISSETRGLWGGGLREAVDEYARTGRITDKPCFKYRDPVTGQCHEREFNPLELVRRLEGLGFTATLMKPTYNPAHLLASLAAKLVSETHPLSLIVSPKFEIIAVKQSV